MRLFCKRLNYCFKNGALDAQLVIFHVIFLLECFSQLENMRVGRVQGNQFPMNTDGEQMKRGGCKRRKEPNAREQCNMLKTHTHTDSK